MLEFGNSTKDFQIHLILWDTGLILYPFWCKSGIMGTEAMELCRGYNLGSSENRIRRTVINSSTNFTKRSWECAYSTQLQEATLYYVASYESGLLKLKIVPFFFFLLPFNL